MRMESLAIAILLYRTVLYTCKEGEDMNKSITTQGITQAKGHPTSRLSTAP
jgi:hypothetical protein